LGCDILPAALTEGRWMISVVLLHGSWVQKRGVNRDNGNDQIDVSMTQHALTVGGGGENSPARAVVAS